MNFLTPPLLWSLGALLVPIIIHLWQRRRVVAVPFSTLRFLRVVSARTSRSAKLEHLLLFLMRSAVVALVAAAAAKPVLSSLSARILGAQVPRMIAVVVDQSYSMGYKVDGRTRLEIAQECAQTLLADLRPGDSVAVFGVSNRPRAVVPELTVDHSVAQKAVKDLTVTEGRGDFASALKEAWKVVSKKEKGEPQIFVFSDGQALNWQFDPETVFDAQWKSSKVKLLMVRTDANAAGNAALEIVNFDSAQVSAGSTVRAMATVANHSDAPIQDVLEVRVGEERVAQRSVEAAPRERVRVPFEFQAPMDSSGKWLQGTASLSGDRLPVDDRHYFTLPLVQPPKVLVVEQGAGPEKARPGFYLRKAFSAGMAQAPLKTVTPSELDDLSVDTYTAVFLLGLPGISERSALRLERYLEAGGTVAVFAGEGFSPEAWTRVEWMPAVASKLTELPAERQPTLLLEPQHPLFTLWDANTPFSALPQKKALSWAPRKGARALVSMGKGIPFVMYGERGAGKVVVLNASADMAWGGFPISPVFLPMVQEIARLSGVRADKAGGIQVGDAVPVPPAFAKEKGLSLRLPSRETLPLAANAPALEEASRAGHYELTNSQEEVLWRFSVNVDPLEGDLSADAQGELAKRFPLPEVVGREDLNQWLEKSHGMVPLWPLLLLLALLIFIAESVYSNRLAAARAQGEAEHVKTGYLNRRRFGQRKRADASAVAEEVAG